MKVDERILQKSLVMKNCPQICTLLTRPKIMQLRVFNFFKKNIFLCFLNYFFLKILQVVLAETEENDSLTNFFDKIKSPDLNEMPESSSNPLEKIETPPVKQDSILGIKSEGLF